jgi:hypothetical protein
MTYDAFSRLNVVLLNVVVLKLKLPQGPVL